MDTNLYSESDFRVLRILQAYGESLTALGLSHSSNFFSLLGLFLNDIAGKLDDDTSVESLLIVLQLNSLIPHSKLPETFVQRLVSACSQISETSSQPQVKTIYSWNKWVLEGCKDDSFNANLVSVAMAKSLNKVSEPSDEAHKLLKFNLILNQTEPMNWLSLVKQLLVQGRVDVAEKVLDKASFFLANIDSTQVLTYYKSLQAFVKLSKAKQTAAAKDNSKGQNSAPIQKRAGVQIDAQKLIESLPKIADLKNTNSLINALEKLFIIAIYLTKEAQWEQLKTCYQQLLNALSATDHQILSGVMGLLPADKHRIWLSKLSRVCDTILTRIPVEEEQFKSQLESLKSYLQETANLSYLTARLTGLVPNRANITSAYYLLLLNPETNSEKLTYKIEASEPESITNCMADDDACTITYQNHPHLNTFVKISNSNCSDYQSKLKYLQLISGKAPLVAAKTDTLQSQTTVKNVTCEDLSQLRTSVFAQLGMASEADISAMEVWVKTANITAAKTLLFIDLALLLTETSKSQSTSENRLPLQQRVTSSDFPQRTFGPTRVHSPPAKSLRSARF